MIYADAKLNTGIFQQSRGCNSKICDLIWSVYLLIRVSNHVYLIWKFQEDLNKTEQVMLMTKSNTSFFSNHGDITLRLMSWLGQFSNSSKSSPMFFFFLFLFFICMFQEDPIKIEQVTLMTKSNKGFFSNHGDLTNINDPTLPVFKLVRNLIHAHLICKFQEHLKELWWWLAFAPCKYGTLWLP